MNTTPTTTPPPFDMDDPFGVKGLVPERPPVVIDTESQWEADAYDIIRQEVQGGAHVYECDPEVVKAARRYARRTGRTLRFAR